jgi:hypothetical protein
MSGLGKPRRAHHTPIGEPAPNERPFPSSEQATPNIPFFSNWQFLVSFSAAYQFTGLTNVKYEQTITNVTVSNGSTTDHYLKKRKQGPDTVTLNKRENPTVTDSDSSKLDEQGHS